MPLSDDIATLRDQVLGDLTAAHDYYTNTKQAWRHGQNHCMTDSYRKSS
jgi:hypothetical protein